MGRTGRRKNLRNRKEAAAQRNTDERTSKTTNRGLETRTQKNQSETSETTDRSLRMQKRATTQKNTDDGTSETTNRGLETKPQKNQSETSETADKSLRMQKRATTQKNTDDGTSETTNRGFETESRKNQPGTSATTDDGLETQILNQPPGIGTIMKYGAVRCDPVSGKDIIQFQWTAQGQLAILMAMAGISPYGVHKHMDVYIIKTRLKKVLNLDIPINTIWTYLEYLYDLKQADAIEPVDKVFSEDKDFELPQTEEWRQLIEEQRALIQKGDNKNTDGTLMDPGTSGL
ncbi:uncharacterized protein LOC111041164 isoform X2 [Myzus persicae]|uniref:uncharacterized protein LOC111041164 isoform X2 n=1 Tax=Myzus persicae TaxID=13164 RepID=UPI000B93703D|nr:uncharacterized protein LOC111041164 isoform X2 [Myzus persicae]